MAKYDVTYSCGHTGTVHLDGPTKERFRKIEWMGRGKCPDCERAAREAANAAAAAQSAAEGLAALVGSPKQIAWAETLRREMIAKVEGDDKTPAPAKAMIADLLREMDDAVFFIDARQDTVRGIARLLMLRKSYIVDGKVTAAGLEAQARYAKA